MRLIDIVTGPWAIQPAKLQEIAGIYATHLRGERIDLESVEARLGAPLQHSQDAEYVVDQGVAIIQIDGPIAPKANMFTRVSGGASAQIIEQQVVAAAADPFVRAILLEIDSPGGSVFGTPEVAAAVREAAQVKPIVAWSAGVIASGAYWIASSADRIFISNGTVPVVGSIGVVATHIDVSRAEASRGVKTTEITAGKYKRITSQYEPLSAEGRASLQDMVDAIYEGFVNAVAENRGVDVKTVLSKMADGRDFVGQQAVDAGLVDGVRSRSALMAELASGGYAKRRGPQMVTAGAPDPAFATTVQEHNMAEAKPITVDVVRAEHPAVAEALIAQGREEGIKAGASAERDRIKGIEAVAMRGYEAIVDAAKFDGKSTAGDVAASIVAAQKVEQAEALDRIRAQAPEPAKPAAAPDDKPKKDGHPTASAEQIAVRAADYQSAEAKAGRRISMAEAVTHVSKEA